MSPPVTRSAPQRDAARTDAETARATSSNAGVARRFPTSSTPLDAEDLVRLLRDCIARSASTRRSRADVTVNTVHYYRRKDIIDPPVGKTAAARYELRHVWQLAGARLAGHLGLVTLAEARDVIRGADEATSTGVSRRARRGCASARRRARRSGDGRRRRAPASAPGARWPKPALPTTSTATLLALPGNAWCVVPAAHAAHHSPEAADALARALAVALRRLSIFVRHSCRPCTFRM